MTARIKNPKHLPFSIWAIGLASCLLNMSSALVFSLSAVYLNGQGVGIQWISTLEQVVEGIAYLMKVFSGVISDFFQRRKTIMLMGFGLAMISRPILAYSVSFFAAGMAFTVIFLSRVFERIGNGMQSTPRDALVADLSPSERKGECFGLRTALSNLGSFVGAGVGVLAMYWTSNNYQQIFWLACLPPVLAFFILAFFVKDAEHKEQGLHTLKSSREHVLQWRDIARLGRSFWFLMLIVAFFMMARVNESLLSLHAHKTFALPEQWVPLVVLIYNATNFLTAYPIGRFSDRVPRPYLLALGCFCLVAADFLLALAPNLGVALLGVGLWGVQIGITQSMFLALIADYVPADLRGTGFGIFYLVSAAAILLAGMLGGMVAERFSIAAMYGGSGVVALFSLSLLLAVYKLGKVGKSQAAKASFVARL